MSEMDQKERWRQYSEAMKTIAPSMHTNVECNWKYRRLSVNFEISHLTVELASALSVVEDIFGLVSEFPPEFIEQLEPASPEQTT